MTRFHCPYCSPLYQIHKELSNGEMVCGHCGELLKKRPLIKFTQIFAIISISAFIAPLITLILVFLQDSYKPHIKKPAISLQYIFKVKEMTIN